jgi:hypothetical protein
MVQRRREWFLLLLCVGWSVSQTYSTATNTAATSSPTVVTTAATSAAATSTPATSAPSSPTNSQQALAYQELFLIPGADFVGFGYDARYVDPIQAVRLPVTQWDFQQAKTYRYPVYKDYRFRVPDELFVRTVAKTDQNNYVFQSVEELSQQLAFNAGLNYTKSSTSSSDATLTADEKQTLLKALYPNGTNASTNQTAALLNNAGYGSSGYIPETNNTMATSMFSVGAEFNFLNTVTNTNTAWITQNEQINQYYQLFLDKRTLKQEFLDDSQKLAGRLWRSDDRKLFTNFLEKYGTHIVVSAMMGGAISMTSVVQNTASVTNNNITTAATLLSNATSTTNNSQTQTQTYVSNSPNCTGLYSGYTYDTFNKICIEPPEITCYAPMQFYEPFNSLTNDQNLPWTWQLGPDKLVIRDNGVRTCSKYRFCPPFEDVTMSRSDPNNPTGPFTGQVAWWNDNTWALSAQKQNFVFFKGWEVNISSVQNPDQQIYTYYPNEVQSSSDCGSYYCSWFLGCMYGDVCVWANPTFYNDAVITLGNMTDVGTGKFLSIDSTQQGYLNDNNYSPHPQTTYKRGRTVDIPAANPQVFSFYVYSVTGSSGGPHNFLEMWDGGDPSITTDDVQIFTYRHTATTFGFDQGGVLYDAIFPVVLRTGIWFKVILNINWNSKTFDFWVKFFDTTVPSLQRLQADIPFMNPNAARMSKINLYNNNVGTFAHFDELRFCNDQGSQYVPVTRQSAVQSSVSRFRQTVNGQIDFSFETSLGQYTFTQSSNYRLKGGDSSQVDLLDLRKVYNTFDVWKGTIIQNPAPVSFVLKKISSVFPDEVVNNVNRRDEMSFAIDQYLLLMDTTSIIVDNNPDEKRMMGITV